MLYRVKALGSEDLLVTGNSTIEAYHGIIKALVLDVLKSVPHLLPIRVHPHWSSIRLAHSVYDCVALDSPSHFFRARVQGRRCDWLVYVLITFGAVRYQRKALVAVHRAYQQGGNAVVRGMGADAQQDTAGASTPAAAAADAVAAVTRESTREAAEAAFADVHKFMQQIQGEPAPVEIAALESVTAYLHKVNHGWPQFARTD